MRAGEIERGWSESPRKTLDSTEADGPAGEPVESASPITGGDGHGGELVESAERASPTTVAESAGSSALAHARALTKCSGSSFYYSFLLLPKPKREAIYAVYALARAIDDAVDESGTPEAGRARLSYWREEVARLGSGRPRHVITRAVAEARERYPIPVPAIEALLDGAQMDLERRRYHTFEELKVYCEHVASAVGRMCLEIFGYSSRSALAYADDLGVALQLTNILRDLGSDARRGRLYLPQADLDRFGVREEDLLAGRRTPAVLDLLGFEAERARTFYRAAEGSLDPRDRRRLVAAEVMRFIYRSLLARIERSGFDVFERRQSLSRPHRAALAATVFARTLVPWARRRRA